MVPPRRVNQRHTAYGANETFKELELNSKVPHKRNLSRLLLGFSPSGAYPILRLNNRADFAYQFRAEPNKIIFDHTQAQEALAAFERFGKGMLSQARLNLCDCAAYAQAKTMALLFKGTDFGQTDVCSAV